MEAEFNTKAQKLPFGEPKKVIENFLKDWSPSILRVHFVEIFGLAVIGGLEQEKTPLTPEYVASLFDELVDLVTAVQALHSLTEAAESIHLLPAGEEGGTTHE